MDQIRRLQRFQVGAHLVAVQDLAQEVWIVEPLAIHGFLVADLLPPPGQRILGKDLPVEIARIPDLAVRIAEAQAGGVADGSVQSDHVALLELRELGNGQGEGSLLGLGKPPQGFVLRRLDLVPDRVVWGLVQHREGFPGNDLAHGRGVRTRSDAQDGLTNICLRRGQLEKPGHRLLQAGIGFGEGDGAQVHVERPVRRAIGGLVANEHEVARSVPGLGGVLLR